MKHVLMLQQLSKYPKEVKELRGLESAHGPRLPGVFIPETFKG